MITSDLPPLAHFTARIDKSVGRAVHQAAPAPLPADLQRFGGAGGVEVGGGDGLSRPLMKREALSAASFWCAGSGDFFGCFFFF